MAERFNAPLSPPPTAGSRRKREKLGIMNNFKVYILKSLNFNRYYVGYSADAEKRLSEHNKGKVRSTKAYKPWKIIYFELSLS